MCEAQSITSGLPFCQTTKGTQTNLSIGLRTTVVILGTISAIGGILVLFGITGLSQFGTTAGWTAFSLGALLAFIGASIKCVKNHSNNEIQKTSTESNKDNKNLPIVNDSVSGKGSSSSGETLAAQNLSIESAREEFLEWFRNGKNKLGDGEYEQVIARTKQMAKELPSEKMTLHYQWFNWGFSFYYGENDEKKLIPITWQEGHIMKWQAEKEITGSSWPLLDTQKNAYYTPKVTVDEIGPPSGSMPSGTYISDLLRTAEDNQESLAYRILEVLTPYAKIMKEDSPSLYRDIRSLIPTYPENPI